MLDCSRDPSDTARSSFFERAKSKLLSEATVSSDDDGQTEVFPEDVAANEHFLSSPDPEAQSMAVCFFAQTPEAVTADVFQSIVALGETADQDLAAGIADFLGHMVRSPNITLDSLISIGSLDVLFAITRRFPSSESIARTCLWAFRRFYRANRDVFVSLMIERDLAQLLIELMLAGRPRVVGEALKVVNLWFADPQLVTADQNPVFESAFVQCFTALLQLGDITIQSLVLNSLSLFCLFCLEESVVALLQSGFADRLGEIVLAPIATPEQSNLLEAALRAIFAISGSSDACAKACVPIVSEVLALPARDSISRTLPAILLNFAASDDQELIEFVLTPPCLGFIGSMISEQKYRLQKQAVKIFCFLAIGVPELFCEVLFGDNLNWLSLVVQLLGDQDVELVETCLECLAALGGVLAANPEQLQALVDCIAEENGMDMLNEIAADAARPGLVQLATTVLDYCD